jgi:hypothetical protein
LFGRCEIVDVDKRMGRGEFRVVHSALDNLKSFFKIITLKIIRIKWEFQIDLQALRRIINRPVAFP